MKHLRFQRFGPQKQRGSTLNISAARRGGAVERLKQLKKNRGTQVASYAVGAAAGTAAALIRPGTLAGVSENVVQSAREWNLPQVADFFASEVGHVTGAAIRAAGLAGLAYDMAKVYRSTETDTGSRVAQMGAVFLAGGLSYLQGIGPIILAIELLSGSAVTNSVRAAAALCDASLTGDRRAFDQWLRQTHNGENGWLLRELAQFEPMAQPLRTAAERAIVTAASPHEVALEDLTAVNELSQAAQASFESW